MGGIIPLFPNMAYNSNVSINCRWEYCIVLNTHKVLLLKQDFSGIWIADLSEDVLSKYYRKLDKAKANELLKM